MTEIELNNEYFEWMCQLVCSERYSRRLSYRNDQFGFATERRKASDKF